MTATPKKKLCWNCDGNVPLRAEHCPYCGVYIEQIAGVADEEPEEQEYAPPYPSGKATAHATEAPAPPFASRTTAKQQNHSHAASLPVARTVSDIRTVIVPMLCLLIGSAFLLFGIALLLFSDNGVFTLKWNGDHWIVYLGLGVLALAAGWRFLHSLDTEQPQ